MSPKKYIVITGTSKPAATRDLQELVEKGAVISQDTTANFYFAEGQWRWADTEEVLKRSDLVNGWMLYPQPPPLARKGSR